MKDLVPSGGYGLLYSNMRSAIASCHAIDELAEVANKSVAMAAYLKQIKDDDAVRKFQEIRLRSYRRIGQLLSEGLDTSVGYYHRMQQVRERFATDPTVCELTDSRIIDMLKIAALQEDNFENAVAGAAGRIGGQNGILFAADPEAQARQAKQEARWHQERKEREAQWEAKANERRQKNAETEELVEELMDAHKVALGEIGFTMDRRDRDQMHKIVFLIKKDIHSVLRQAAFDHHITMQEILRRGLMMWFAAHGYQTDFDREKAA